MQSLTNEELLAISQAQVEPSQHKRQTELDKNEESLLTSEERQELAALRQAADHLMLRKAYAWSLLRWRGQRIPAPKRITVAAVTISQRHCGGRSLRTQTIAANIARLLRG